MDFKLKLKSKKLDSGKYQVRFSTEGFRSDYYGYLLAEPRTSLREVVEVPAESLFARPAPEQHRQCVAVPQRRAPI
jgi:hypothetical protein